MHQQRLHAVRKIRVMSQNRSFVNGNKRKINTFRRKVLSTVVTNATMNKEYNVLSLKKQLGFSNKIQK